MLYNNFGVKNLFFFSSASPSSFFHLVWVCMCFVEQEGKKVEERKKEKYTEI